MLDGGDCVTHSKEKTFRIVTLGCKVNQYESAYLNEAMASSGWVPAGKARKSEVTIVNTCMVTQRAAHQSRQEIRKAVRGGGRVAVTGCYAQAFPDELSRIEGVWLVTGNSSKGRLPAFLSENMHSAVPVSAVEPFPPRMPFENLPLSAFPQRTRAYLKVQDGCESFCSYCIVPYARGPYRSLPEKEVLSQMGSFCAKGYREIVLTGIHLGKYGVDLGQSAGLFRLLSAIGKEGYPARVRLSSIEPNEWSDEVIEMSATERWLCPHFHIPLQSGDDGILEKMNRRYTSLEFGRLIEKIHQRIPFAAVGVDVMAGFPGETENAHRNTCSLIRDLPFSYLHVFPFSPRRGTPAAGFSGRIGPEALKARASELRKIGQGKREAFYRACLGRDFQVLTEEYRLETTKGFSENYLPVVFPSPGPLENAFVQVRVEKVEKDGVSGSLLSLS